MLSVPLMPSEPEVPFVARKVHVAPVGFEIDRVVEPIVRMKGDLAILLANVADADQATYFRRAVEEGLRKARVELDLIRAPIYDLYQTCEEILEVFRKYRKDRLYYNVSSGSKIQSLSGYIASNLARAEGIIVETYYAEPKGYAPTRDQPLSHGFSRAFSLPILTVRTPDRPSRAAMSLLANGPLSKISLATKLASNGILDRQKLGADGRPRDNACRASLQAAVDSKVIRPLSEWGFVTSERVGKHLRVSLTEQGKLALRLYRESDIRV
jgi:hypothetical protein